MSNIPTPHISSKISDIADTVLMPGDPLRAKFIADNYLLDYKCINNIRNVLGYTGKYKGKYAYRAGEYDNQSLRFILADTHDMISENNNNVDFFEIRKNN